MVSRLHNSRPSSAFQRPQQMATKVETRSPPIKIIQTKRSPPLWSVKVGVRYVASDSGAGAKVRAIVRAQEFGEPEVIERPEPKRTGRIAIHAFRQSLLSRASHSLKGPILKSSSGCAP